MEKILGTYSDKLTSSSFQDRMPGVLNAAADAFYGKTSIDDRYFRIAFIEGKPDTVEQNSMMLEGVKFDLMQCDSETFRIDMVFPFPLQLIKEEQSAADPNIPSRTYQCMKLGSRYYALKPVI